jgi:hypothetical protein
MLNIAEAGKALIAAVPSATIQDSVLSNDLYIFRIKFSDPGEENYDPFFSVNVNTGEVKDFSILTDLIDKQ